MRVTVVCLQCVFSLYFMVIEINYQKWKRPFLCWANGLGHQNCISQTLLWFGVVICLWWCFGQWYVSGHFLWQLLSYSLWMSSGTPAGVFHPSSLLFPGTQMWHQHLTRRAHTREGNLVSWDKAESLISGLTMDHCCLMNPALHTSELYLKESSILFKPLVF